MSEAKDEKKQPRVKAIKYNGTQFKRLYQEYAKQFGLNGMNRKNRFHASNWHSHDRKYVRERQWKDKGYNSTTAVPLYEIDNGSIVIYQLTQDEIDEAKRMLNLDTNEQFLQYVVEEFVMHISIASNKDKNLIEARREYNRKYDFDHDIEFPTLSFEDMEDVHVLVLLKK